MKATIWWKSIDTKIVDVRETMNVKEEARKMKLSAPYMAATDTETRNTALKKIALALQENAERIFEANKADLERAASANTPKSVMGRLKFDAHKLETCVEGINQLITLEDPIGKVTLSRELDEGLLLNRVTCPIGVIGVIFEARPDALVQISTLCIKSGNCAILKGGKETAESNRVLFEIIKNAAVAAGLPEGCLFQAELHSEIDELLDCHGDVDLLIPRGSNSFVQYIMDHTKIPVMGHADGICHTYVDKDCDFLKAEKVIIDAKTQYTSVCNATETLLVNRDVSAEFLPVICSKLAESGVKIHGNEEVKKIISETEISDLPEDGFAHEYLDMEIGVKVVGSLEEAIEHINKFGSHHTDCIISENAESVQRFMQLVDSANVYANCSTRFADGFRYGFGAEVGISTGKIHARGPVGLEGLMTYKYKLFGSGQIVADYAEGKKEFHFRDF